MTWKEFKEVLEEEIKDDMEIDYIDFSGYGMTIEINKEDNSFKVY